MCATANLISESIIKHLGISVIAHSVSIGTLSIESKGVVQVTSNQFATDFVKRDLIYLIIPTI